jgi:hypothetical protein
MEMEFNTMTAPLESAFGLAEFDFAAFRDTAEWLARQLRKNGLARGHRLDRIVDPWKDHANDPEARTHMRHALLEAMEQHVPGDIGRPMADWIIRLIAREFPIGVMPVHVHTPPLIEIKADNRADQIQLAEQALVAAGMDVYQRGGRVYQLIRHAERSLDGVGGTREIYRTYDVGDLRLQELFDRAAKFTRFDARTKQYVAVGCPDKLPTTYLARAGADWSLPNLNGVIRTPTLRRDGSLLDLPGWDFRTELFLDMSGGVLPEIPAKPTREDAEAAINTLADLIDEFPFTDEPSRAVALSAIITAVVRPALSAAPMHAITATTFGSGKSYLTDVISVIATGDVVPVIACGTNDEELEKRLAAALIEGRQFIAIDNINREINGPLLNQMITQPMVAPRRLGKSENVAVVCTAFITGNGNNLQVPADMARRVLLCSLDAKSERPELREFYLKPLELVRQDRMTYVAAALTIARAYIAAEMPNRPRPLGGFAQWSDWVRGALVWLGEADPAATMDTVRELDPARQRMIAIMQQWNEVIGGRPVTVRQIIDAAVAQPSGELREALLTVAGDRGAISGRVMGKWLSEHRGRLDAGLSFERGKMIRGNHTWVLQGGRDIPAAPASATEDIRAMLE